MSFDHVDSSGGAIYASSFEMVKIVDALLTPRSMRRRAPNEAMP